jgi:hypothetical protein
MHMSCHNMQHKIVTKREYKGKIYVENIEKNSCRMTRIKNSPKPKPTKK